MTSYFCVNPKSLAGSSSIFAAGKTLRATSLPQTDECSRESFQVLGSNFLPSRRSRTEDRSSQAHARRALRDRDFEVVRHAHGKHVIVNRCGFARGDSVAQLAEPAEVGASLLRIVGERWHRHQPAKLQCLELRRSQQQFFQLLRIRRYAGLGRLATNVDF